MVVQVHVPVQRLTQVLLAVESVRLQYIGNATVETFNHAVGARRFRLDQAVLNVQLLACLVKHVLAAGLALTAGKQPIGELRAIVGQHLGDPDRASLVHCLQKGLGIGCRLAALDLHEHPARGPVDGHKQIAALAFIGHLGQVLDVHMHIARFIELEALGRFFGLLGQQGLEIAHAMAAQATIQA